MKKCERVRGSAGREIHANQLRERVALELFHNARLVDLDGPRADAELSGDLTILVPRGDQHENLALAAGQALDTRVGGGARGRRRAPLAIGTQRVAQYPDQHNVAD